jgi:hypothetical protein
VTEVHSRSTEGEYTRTEMRGTILGERNETKRIPVTIYKIGCMSPGGMFANETNILWMYAAPYAQHKLVAHYVGVNKRERRHWFSTSSPGFPFFVAHGWNHDALWEDPRAKVK